jgi:uncharacterized protein (DUF2147 family)
MARMGIVALALCACVGAWSFAANPVPADSPILGRWLTEPRDGIIEITRAEDGSLQGRIIGGNAPQRLDARNPDPARRQRLLLGQIILVGMRPEGENAWAGGTIYDPDSGRTYRCHIELLDPDRLKVRGFIGFSLLGRTQTWTRYRGTALELPGPDR